MHPRSGIGIRLLLSLSLLLAGLPAPGAAMMQADPGAVESSASADAPASSDEHAGCASDRATAPAKPAPDCHTAAGDCCDGDCAQACMTLVVLPVSPPPDAVAASMHGEASAFRVPGSRPPENPLRPPQH